MSTNSTCTGCGRQLTGVSGPTLCAVCTPARPGHPADDATVPSVNTSAPARDATASADPAVPDPRVVGRLHDRGYRVVRKLGSGGYGAVYEAVDAAGRRVAVKVLHGYVASDLVLARFREEARALAVVRHPGLVALYHYDPDPSEPLLVTEFVPGGTLSERIKAGGPLPPAAAARLVAAVARAADHLHDSGALHRDVKPSNILLGPAGPKLTDFGLVKRAAAGEPLTVTGHTVGGTPEYCAPEQFRWDAVCDRRCDVYALGATLYAAVCGRPPFARDADDPQGDRLIRRLLREPLPPDPRAVRPDLPAGVAAVCLRALAKDPADRYATAGELADELDRVAPGEPVRARPPGRARAARRWGVAAAAAALACGVAVAVTLLTPKPVEATPAPIPFADLRAKLHPELVAASDVVGPAADGEDALLKELQDPNANMVSLTGKDGAFRYLRPRLGETTVRRPRGDPAETWFDATGEGVVDVCPPVPLDRYSVQFKLRELVEHIDPVANGARHSVAVGVGYQHAADPTGAMFHAGLLLRVHDLDYGAAAKTSPPPDVRLYHDVALARPDRATWDGSRTDLGQLKFTAARRPGAASDRWRWVKIDVRPEAVKAYWLADDGSARLIAAVTPADRDEATDRSDRGLTRDHPGLTTSPPRWSPRGAIALYASRGAYAVKDAVVFPDAP